ncbi:MAG: hypothetical protein H0X24_20600 [Ktedonobacterales bacterium]|nr:hypothetical protein [Ktedonobacterales bacterium]
MSHIIHVSDDAYEVISVAAEANKQTPETFIEAIAQRLLEKPVGHPMDADEFVRSLGFSDADIAAADAAVRQRYPEFFANEPE